MLTFAIVFVLWWKICILNLSRLWLLFSCRRPRERAGLPFAERGRDVARLDGRRVGVAGLSPEHDPLEPLGPYF